MFILSLNRPPGMSSRPSNFASHQILCPILWKMLSGYCTERAAGARRRMMYAVRLNDTWSRASTQPDYQRLLDEARGLPQGCHTGQQRDIGAFYMCAYDYTETKLEDPWAGLKVRSDWLTECDLKVPTTIEELTNVLRTFKEKKGASAPMSGFPAYEQYDDFILGAWTISAIPFSRGMVRLTMAPSPRNLKSTFYR